MKFARYKVENGFRVGLVVEESLVDVATALNACRGTLSQAAMKWLGGDPGDMRALIASGPALLDDLRRAAEGGLETISDFKLAPPISPADKLICTWINYGNPNMHVTAPKRSEPLFFTKFFSTLCAHGDDILLPAITSDVIPEAEICAVIGKAGRNIAPEDALDHVFGYTILNDVTALSHTLNALIGVVAPYMMSKNFATFAPIGPYLTTRDEIPDPGALSVKLWLDESLVVDSHTSLMLTGVADLIAYLSRFFELNCGDVIVCGGAPWLTPKPPVLNHGQTVKIAIDGLGMLQNRVVAE